MGAFPGHYEMVKCHFSDVSRGAARLLLGLLVLAERVGTHDRGGICERERQLACDPVDAAMIGCSARVS